MDERERILAALTGFMHQTPGMEFANYGDAASYRAEYRGILRDLHDAEKLMAQVSWRSSIDAAALREAFRAFSGRLTLNEYHAGESCPYGHAAASKESRRCGICCATGKVVEDTTSLEYCTGQYFPTEYRKAVCAVLASALWDYWRKDYPTGDAIREHARKELGAQLARRWLD